MNHKQEYVDPIIIPEEETAEDILRDSAKEATISSMIPKDIEGIELLPFSLMRQIIAADLCDGPRQPFFSCIMTLWVCTLQPSEALKAHKNIIGSQQIALDWAEKLGFSFRNRVIYEKWLKIYRELDQEIAETTKAIPKGGGNTLKNDGGQQDS